MSQDRGGFNRQQLATSPQLWWQCASAITVVVYFASLVLVHRPASGYLTFWDGWVGNIAGTLPIVPVALRVRHPSRLRGAWMAIGLGIVLNDIANVLYMFHDANLNPIPDPAPSDVPYLLSYAAFIVGVAMITQQSFGRRLASIRLDGAIAGLAIASLASILWFDPVLKVSGRPLQVVVGMAYPLCDLVLLVLLVAGLAPQQYRPNLPTGVLMLGVLCFIVGDVIYLNETAANTYVQGTWLDGTWALGIWMISLAAWPAEDRRSPPGRRLAQAPSGFILVPVLFGILSVVVLGVSVVHHTSAVTSAMALGSLSLVIVRMTLTLREVRRGAENFRDARTDELTGLKNRRAFLEDVETQLLSLQSPQHLGILMIDLDGFKEVNDSLGHTCGDELLEIVGQRFLRRLGDRGSMARLGGDEFACAAVVPSCDTFVALAHELGGALSDPVSLDGVTVRVGASIGVAVTPDHGSNQTELLRSADVAMYEAKRTQAEVCVYQSEYDLNSRERLAMIDDLRCAIEARSLTLHFQPTRDFGSDTTRGVEALVRWHHPVRGLLYPDDFIPLAERVGLVPQLTRAVLEIAIAEAATLDRAGWPLQMSVNISRYDLIDEQLPPFIDRLLQQHDLPPGRLTLEVTESSIGEDPQRAKQSIEALRRRGIRISIDDFGVGYSSMSQLLELPIDELKIDKSFVLALESDQRAGAIISSTIELARALNLTVVAEGIENQHSLASVRDLGTNTGQGYHIARPLTPAQLHEFLARTGVESGTASSAGVAI